MLLAAAVCGDGTKAIWIPLARCGNRIESKARSTLAGVVDLHCDAAGLVFLDRFPNVSDEEFALFCSLCGVKAACM